MMREEEDDGEDDAEKKRQRRIQQLRLFLFLFPAEERLSVPPNLSFTWIFHMPCPVLFSLSLEQYLEQGSTVNTASGSAVYQDKQNERMCK